MSPVPRFDHVGITVADIDAAVAFFVALGLEVEGRMFMEGEFVDTVIGIPNSRSEIVTLRPPGGGTGLELSRFIRPDHEPGSPDAMSNELGLRNVCFEVDNLQDAVDRLAADWLPPGWRHRPVRADLAHGLRARAGGDHRGPCPANRLTRVGRALRRLALRLMRYLDPVLLGRGLDASPGRITLGLAHILDLVEPRDRVADVSSVGQRLFALLGERELRRWDLVFRMRAQRVLSS